MGGNAGEVLRRAQAALQAGEFEHAERLVGPISEGEPQAQIVMVNALMMQRRYRDVLPWLDRLLGRRRAPALVKARAHALNGIGIEALEEGDLETAARCFDEALATVPGHPEARFNRAICHLQAGEFRRARGLIDPMLKARPDAETRLYGAIAHAGSADHAGAIILLEEAAAAAGDDGELLQRIGDEFARLFQHRQSAACFERALALTPGDSALALKASGESMRSGEVAAAESGLRQLIEDPDHGVAALEQLQQLLIDEGRAEEGPALLAARTESALPLRVLLAAHATAGAMPADENAIDAERQRIHCALQAMLEQGPPEVTGLGDLHWTNFYLAYHGRDNREINSLAGDLLGRAVAEVDPAALEPLAPRGRKIGFLSSHWGNTVIGSYFGAWVQAAGQAGFETVLLTIPAGYNVPNTELIATADQTITLDADPDRRWRQVRELRLAGIVIPELGADGSTVAMAACRLAPVQLAGWGHPDTSGLATVDGFFSARCMEPEDGASGYREPLLGLPGLGTFYANPGIALSTSRSDFSLPEDARLYLFPHSPFKVHHDTLRVMTRMLSEDPEGRLVLFEFHETGLWQRYLGRLHEQLDQAGLDPGKRLQVLPYMARDRFLNVLGLCNVMIDNIHYSGGNSSLDALSMGLPVVTWPRALMRGRQTAGMLRVAGHPELIARDENDFVDRCVDVARDYGRDRAERLQVDVGERLFDDPEPLRAIAEHLECLLG